MDLLFDRVLPQDLGQIDALQPTGWTGMADRFAGYIQNETCTPIKAEHQGTIIGVGASIRFEKTAWIAHIVVHEAYRKRGIGSHILQHLLNQLEQEDVASISLLATKSGESVYKKANFRTLTEYIFFTREGQVIQTERSANIIPYAAVYDSHMFQLDRLISGEDRENLIRPHLKNALVYLKNDQILGYYLPTLVEGPIYALSNEAGLALMALRCPYAKKAVVPIENPSAIAYLHQQGFRETGLREKRMILGKDISWRPGCIYNRVGGNYG